MKKNILMLGLSVLLFSCSKTNEQVEMVKLDLIKNQNITEKETSLLTFNVSEVLGKDAYANTFDIFSKNQIESFSVGAYDVAKETDLRIDSMNVNFDKIRDKIYYRVDVFRIAGKDTVTKKLYFLTDKNKIYNYVNLK